MRQSFMFMVIHVVSGIYLTSLLVILILVGCGVSYDLFICLSLRISSNSLPFHCVCNYDRVAFVDRQRMHCNFGGLPKVVERLKSSRFKFGFRGCWSRVLRLYLVLGSAFYFSGWFTAISKPENISSNDSKMGSFGLLRISSCLDMFSSEETILF